MLIYKIVTPHSPKCYVGKTTCTLQRRLWDHEGHFRSWQQLKPQRWCSSYGLLWLGDYTIELLEDTADKFAEARWIRKLDCVNIVKLSVSVEERKQRALASTKRWTEENKDHCTKYLADWYQTAQKAKRSVKIPCDRCGFMGTTHHMARHQGTARCIRLSRQQTPSATTNDEDNE